MGQMAIHESASALSIEAIEEFMAAAKLCLRQRKPDGGCFGFAAVSLLFMLVNAFGEYLLQSDGPSKAKVDPYVRAFADPCFGLDLTDGQVGYLRKWYR